MMDDKERFSAYTQRHITFLLIYGLMVLIIGLLVAVIVGELMQLSIRYYLQLIG